MSVTAMRQEVARRGYTLRWSTEPHVEPKEDTLTLDLMTQAGEVAFSNSLPITARGAVITKEGRDAREADLVRWAEEVTRPGTSVEATAVPIPAGIPPTDPIDPEDGGLAPEA